MLFTVVLIPVCSSPRYTIFQAFLVMALDAVMRSYAQNSELSGGLLRSLDSSLADLNMAVTVLERYAPANVAATLCSKVCRSMRRSLQKNIAAQLSSKGKGPTSAVESQFGKLNNTRPSVFTVNQVSLHCVHKDMCLIH